MIKELTLIKIVLAGDGGDTCYGGEIDYRIQMERTKQLCASRKRKFELLQLLEDLRDKIVTDF